MSKVVLRNFGKRTIEVGNAVDSDKITETVLFKPGQALEFPQDVAIRLCKMYPKEVQDAGSVLEAFKVDASATAASDLAPPPPVAAAATEEDAEKAAAVEKGKGKK